MSKSKLKWGVSGCGRFTEMSFLPVISLLRKNQVVSVFSHSKERSSFIAEKFGIHYSYNDFGEFLKSDINAVYIASANNNHYRQVLQAAEAGKNILCEKPLALNSSEAEEMVKVCKANNVKLAVNYSHRFHPLISKAKELISEGLIGKLVAVNINYNVDFPPGSNFRFKKELSGGGALRDLGTHVIDLFRFFGGEISGIKGVFDNIVYKSEVDDFSAGIVSFKDGGYGLFNVSYNSKRGFNRIEILGHTGALSIEKLIGVKTAPAKLTILLEGEGKKSFRKRGNKLLFSLKSVQNSFLKNQDPAASGYDGLINMKLMEELEGRN